MKSTVKNYYDEKSLTYDEENDLLYFKVYDPVTWKYTEPYVPRNPKALVLDAAGGTGKWSMPIAKMGPKVVLTDLSDGMLTVARKKIKNYGLQERIEVRKGDVCDLDFADDTFDMVFCDHALCFIEDQEKAVRELARVLKKNSPIVISGQNRYVLSLSLLSEDPDYSVKVLSNETHFIMRGKLKTYTMSPAEFRSLLERNGLRIEKIVGKVVTMPLAIRPEKFWTKSYSSEYLEQLLRVEMALGERADALALAGHFHAIGYKKDDA